MKLLLITIGIIFTGFVYSQEITNIDKTKAKKDYENILVEKLDSDTNSTSFIIWIKKGVKSHKHKTHSELIYVLEGKGVMTIGNKKTSVIPGDYFRIPQNTFHSLVVSSKKPMKVLSIQSPEFLGTDRIFENNTK